MPHAWSPDELRRLLAACSQMENPAWWRAEILVGYEAGIRYADARALRKDQLDADGTITLRQRKTGVPHVCQVRPETAALLLSLPGDAPLAWSRSKRAFYRQFARLRRLAGVSGGAHQWLRRTGATAVAVEYRSLDAAREWLGHRSMGLVANYVDRSRFHEPCRIPPRVA